MHSRDKGRDMNKIMTAGAALLMTTSIAAAGGLDRSGQSVGVIFEDGNYAELSFGSVSPSVTASAGPYAGGGTVAQDYTQFGLGFRTQVNDKVALAFIMDQPFGSSLEYPGAQPMADVSSTGLTVLGQYEINENFSVHGGIRLITAEGTIDLNPSASFANKYDSGSDVGFVIGGAYERPDIALRVALTYSSATELDLAGVTLPTTLTAKLPQSVNLDFQTGVAADTLVFGSIRWANWSDASISDSSPVGEIYAPENDSFTYNIGVGRRFSESFSGSLSLGYEASQGGTASALAPTDGYLSLQVGGAYTMDNGVEVSGGVRYINIGDAVASTGPFNDNSAIGIGLKVGYNF